jgi:hypothetical protein
MKTNKVILLFSATVILVVMVIFSIILHNTIHARRLAFKKGITLRTLPIGDFNRIVLSDHLNVNILQGKECVVEYPAAKNSPKPLVNNLNGTVHIQAEGDSSSANPGLTAVKITMPSLFEITAGHDSKIQMDSFQADSIHVTLGAGSIFHGRNNTLKQLSFKTSGDAVINISSTF